ncbi:MAG TPA: hypothetical protein VJR29_08515 [bacterium]|nr:hypothetical protein [bacterium]
MSSILLVSWILPLLLGALWLGLLARPRDAGAGLLFGGLSYGLGLGLLGSAFFPWMLAWGPRAAGFAVALFGISILAVLLLRRKCRAQAWLTAAGPSPNRALMLIALALLAIAVALFLLEARRLPHGQYDAWIFWNMRARFLFRAGEEWRQAFSWRTTHGTYPLLLPSIVVQAWNTLARESIQATQWIAAAYAVATLAVLGGSLRILDGKSQGWLGAALLLGQPFFAIHAASLCADVPIGFYFLATFVLAALYDRDPKKNRAWMLLAGISAGMAAWTKVEGVIFVLALVGAKLLTTLVERRFRALWREGLPFGLGLLPWVAMYSYFRWSLPDRPPPMPGAAALPGLTLFQKILDPQRHWIIAKSFYREIWWHPDHFILGPIILLALFAFVFWRRRTGDRSWRCSALALALLIGGYFGAYLLSPFDLRWHLDQSLNRLLLQAWPSMVFLVLLRNSSESRS